MARTAKYIKGDPLRDAAIKLPFKYDPRYYQVDLFAAIQAGIRRAYLVWHRRAGKDKTCWNLLISEAMRIPANYYYIFPLLNQGRKVIWEGRGKDGLRFLDHVPPAIIDGKPYETDMKIKLINGSLIQILGSDNVHAYRGTNPRGIVYSEYATADPMIWDVFRPVLAENGGFAIFNTTPFGHNHAYELWEKIKTNPRWYKSLLTVLDTRNPDGSPLVTEEMIQEDRDSGMDEEMIQQEYYCLHPSTRILTADLRWIPISDANEGDELIGVDEHAAARTNRKFRGSRILRMWQTEKVCKKITFEDGTTVIASDEHPWLEKRAPGNSRASAYQWIETRKLSAGMYIADSGLRPWVTDNSRDAGYLAGIYDGEGCVSRTTVQVSQKAGTVLNEVSRLLMSCGFAGWKTANKGCETISLNLHESLRLLGSIRPKRLLEKSRGIWEGRFPFNGVPARKIVKIEDVGVQPVVGLTTSTKTFIAEGLVTHNCSFAGVMIGSYYGKLMDEAEKDGRIGSFPWDSKLPVYTAWDIGVRDTTTIWFYQKVGRKIYIIDYYEQVGEGVEHYVKYLFQKRYHYAKHYLPHDIKRRDFSSGKNALQVAAELTGRPNFFSVVPRTNIEPGIQAVRSLLPQCFFNFTKDTKRGINALKNYHKKWNPETQSFSSHPDHDWSSHAADGFRGLAMSYEEPADTDLVNRGFRRQRFQSRDNSVAWMGV